MGRFYLGVGILVLFLILGLWVTSSMDTVHQSVAEILDKATAKALSGDLTEGISLAQQAQTSWQNHWHGTASVADHAPMDEIDGLFAQLQVYGQTGQAGDFAAYCARISNLVTAIGEAHGLTWWNFL
jgi:hypothetical protein